MRKIDEETQTTTYFCDACGAQIAVKEEWIRLTKATLWGEVTKDGYLMICSACNDRLLALIRPKGDA